MARKREERAIRNAQRAARKARASQSGQDPSFVSLKQQLVAMGLTLREIPGDGLVFTEDILIFSFIFSVYFTIL